MGSGLALSPKGCWFYLFHNKALKACSKRPKSQKGFVAHYVHQNVSVFARKSLKKWSVDSVLFSMMSMVKCPYWEKTMVYDISHEQTSPTAPEVSSVEHTCSGFMQSREAACFKKPHTGTGIYFQLCCLLASNFASLCLNIPICVVKIKILKSSVAVFWEMCMYLTCIGRVTLSSYPTCWY